MRDGWDWTLPGSALLGNLRDPKPTPNPPVCEAEQGCALAAPSCQNWVFGCWMSFLSGAIVPQPLTRPGDNAVLGGIPSTI